MGILDGFLNGPNLTSAIGFFGNNMFVCHHPDSMQANELLKYNNMCGHMLIISNVLTEVISLI